MTDDKLLPDNSWQWLIECYLNYASEGWPTFYSGRINGLLFPHKDCYQ